MYKNRYFIKWYKDANFSSRICSTPEACDHAKKDGYKEVTQNEFFALSKWCEDLYTK